MFPTANKGCAFDRLQKLGEEKFTKIVNALQRGEPAMALARTIQTQPPAGWGDFQHVAEKTLTQQLNRLRFALADGTFGAARAKAIRNASRPHLDRLNHISVPVLARIEELSEAQRTLVLKLLEKATLEQKCVSGTNEAVEEYRKILLDIQKLRFDLGLDEFKGPIGATLKGAFQSTTLPDGTNVQKQVFEAVSTIEHILNARKIPHLIARE